ncbi:hypothetical protein Pst134EA_006740 [Puccinia striiformis f. sp. tritici]|uniref:hypothetical protein n=1 Tax=Puccinia striiformis f. sp. tritici TaxID=168172 RepID=UPI0020077484|nr:hypothetical protein Pst134EA_006740 [Puccinia striiformis f. sp. tritici]KAH9469451.1 hypothetical protein Pst134EA_006740 [Puccinia striiformis f. sp. tritici]
MTKSIRSNRPELRGLLEAPTRPCGRKSTSEQGGGVQYVDSPREISGDPNQRQSPSDPSQPTVPSELVSVKTGGGLGDGSRRSHPRILGSYPETPYDHARRTSKNAESGSNTHPGQGACSPLEGVPKGGPPRRHALLKKLTNWSSSESEGPPKTHRQRGDREVRQRMEPLGRKEDLLPFGGSEERRLQAQVQKKRQSKELYVPQPNGQSVLVP